MDKKNKRSSSASDDDAETKKHKKSDVETDPVSSSKSLKSDFLLGNRVLVPCSGSKVDLTEQEKRKEINSEETKEMTKSIKVVTKSKKKQETPQTKPDLLEMVSLKANWRDTQEKEDTCCFDCKGAKGNNYETIFVSGFQKLRPRNEIKKMLSDVFGHCGEIGRVFVPMECETRVPLGYAFINYKNPEDIARALKFNGRSLEGKTLKVTMASKRREFYGYTNFAGCVRCITANVARLCRPYGPRYT